MQFALAARQTSQPIAVAAGSIVAVTPDSGGTALVEFTSGTASDIANGIATWAAWPLGTVSAATRGFCASAVFARITSSGGAVTVDIHGAAESLPAPAAVTDSLGNVIGVAGVDGGPVVITKRPLRTINFVGDSLTIFGTMPQIPTGVGYWNIAGQSNISGNWLFLAVVDGRASAISGTPGTLETDGNQRLRWTYPGDSTGAWVDVSQGGFFELPSGSPIVVGHSLYVAICQGNAAAYAPTTAKTDNFTTSGVVQSGKALPHVYAGMVEALLGPNVKCGMYGISGDKVSGVVGARWLQAVQSRPDAVSVLIGVNDAPASAVAAQALASQLIDCLRKMAQYVGKIYVGGLFPNSSVSAASNQYLSIYSTLLREFCATRPDVYRYWDAWNALIDPTTNGSAQKAGAFYSDQIHLQPYGAYLAAQALLAVAKEDFVLPPVSSGRGFVTYDATIKKGAMNNNPRLTGSAGGGSGALGVTGPVPDSWAVTRSGTAQACALSTVARADGPNAFQIQISGAAANDYHELQQTVTLPTGIAAGSMVAFEIDFEIIEATNLSVFQAQINSNANIQSAYILQPPSGRSYNNFNATTGYQPRMCIRSEPILLVAGVTNFTMRFRIGGGVGTTATINIRRFEIIPQ